MGGGEAGDLGSRGRRKGKAKAGAGALPVRREGEDRGGVGGGGAGGGGGGEEEWHSKGQNAVAGSGPGGQHPVARLTGGWCGQAE